MSCFILLKGERAQGRDVPWLTVRVKGSAGDGIEKSRTPWGPRNGGWLCCQSQLPKSIPSPAPSDETENNLPAVFPFPSQNRSILPKERCHWYPGDAGGCSSPVHESRHLRDPVPQTGALAPSRAEHRGMQRAGEKSHSS